MDKADPENPLVPEDRQKPPNSAPNEPPLSPRQEEAAAPQLIEAEPPAAESAAPSAEAEPSEEAAAVDAATTEPIAEAAASAEAEPSEEVVAADAAPAAETSAEAEAPEAAPAPSGEAEPGDEPAPEEAVASAASEEPEAPVEIPKPWLRHYPLEIPASLDYPNHGIPQFLVNAVEKFPANEAVHFLGKSLTYRELYDHTCRLANGLISLGVNRGDRVAIMLPNCPQAVISYYAALMIGAVVVQTNPLYVERELEHQLKDSGATTIITVDLFYERLANVRGEFPAAGAVPQLKNAVITSLKDGLPFPKNLLYPLKQRKEGFKADIPYGRHGVVSYKKLISSSSNLPVLTDIHGSDLAQLQYTGGTTGTPKGVMLTHRNLVANTMQTSAWCYRVKDGYERFLAALPLFHVFGLTVLMNFSIMRAGSLVLLPRFETETVLDTISRQQPTLFPGAPTMYVALINHKNAASTDLSSIEACISGSAALPLEVQEQFEKMTGGKLIEGYGLTEASPVTHANLIWGKRKIGTIGMPFPDTVAAIFSPEGKPLPAREVGELVIRGPQVMKGYWNNPEESEVVLRDGWLHTGDLGYMDEDGFFTIVDRIKDVIIAGGFNIYPREVEEVLYEHPAVMEASVLGVKDPYRGETVKAFIVLKKGSYVSAAQLDVWCRQRLAAFKVPHLYEFRDSLPKTMIGKVLRRKLMEELEKEQPK
ncbi:long-chain-fatty-acid--CoA ligase [Paenibacillus glycanilyticus]|uniref:Long-chain-fatty-acid--CoA ligase n=1 Tax=Paenibacillus glycanilyticus TaxID=126569 RepID=A0ABQ6NNU5_9BACL|nr:long-chain fatty acid--CoA ligase [Paenibacillus glycanilyticus]GMK46771.1 long-chain-fatty-acid--CoA ligase [Paenibacillus glycanilyticus]